MLKDTINTGLSPCIFHRFAGLTFLDLPEVSLSKNEKNI